MNWKQLLSLRRFGDSRPRLRKDQDETRLGFEVDYDRIIFSSAFRSLQDKTQVIPLSQTGFVHTRLTHSLEVSVVGRSLGRMVGQQVLSKYPELYKEGYRFNDFGAIVAAAALAHDIGNPSFGHSGEQAIGSYFSHGKGQQLRTQLTPEQFQDLACFEGNANGFRILTESREGVPGGLRLSYATLGAFLKYPKASLPHKPSSHVADKKFGFFQSETEFFTEVARELGLDQHQLGATTTFARHPLVYLVEAADDICYTIIDFEDGINLGWIDESYALEFLINLVRNTIDTQKYHSLQTQADRLSYLRALAINTLIQETIETFMDNEDSLLQGTFDKALIDKSKYEAQITDIINISKENIYRSQEVIEKEIAGYEILSTLVNAYYTAAEHYQSDTESMYDKLLLRAEGKHFMYKTGDAYQRILSICSYVASLTDSQALQKFRKIKGLDI